jgi:hypothetical protein
MKKAYLVACLFFCYFNSLAQNNSFMGAFISTPVGKFASTDLEDGGGFAESGWGIVFASDLKGKSWPEYFSLYSHSTYQWNSMDNAALSKAYTSYLGQRTTVTQSRYSPVITTLGPKFDIGLAKNLNFGLTGGLGVMFNNTKAFTIKVYDDQNVEVLKEVVNFDNLPAFTYRLGADINYTLLPDVLSLSLFADYTAGTQKVDIEFTNADPTSAHEKLQFFNAGIMLVLISKR